MEEIGAEIGDGMGAQGEDLAVIVECELRAGDVIAAMGVGEERLGAVGGPFHRTPDLLGSPDADRLLGIDEDLGAETAAHIRRDHPQLVSPARCR